MLAVRWRAAKFMLDIPKLAIGVERSFPLYAPVQTLYRVHTMTRVDSARYSTK